MSVPALRFKDDDGREFPEWELNELKELAVINPKTKVLPDEFIYIDLESVEQGFLLKEDWINLENAPSRAQRFISKKDILFQMVRPYQRNNLFFDKIGYYVASTGYAQIRTHQVPKFLYYCLHLDNFVTEVMNRCTGTSYPAINSEALSSIEISKPCSIDEQTKIANFLTAVDEKITHLTQKCELLAQYKKGVMQQIFNQELRFKDDDGQDFPEWKENLIGDIFNDLKGSGLSKDKVSSSGKYKSILYGHLFTKYTEVIKKIDSWTDFNEGLPSKTGDILMPSSTTTTGIDLAKASALKEDRVRLGGDIIVLRAKNAVNSDYFAYYLTHAANREIAEVTQGITIIHLYFKELKKIEVNVPSMKEQTKIAKFLTAIDDKLTHTQVQLAAAKQYKQGLLQQMFV